MRKSLKKLRDPDAFARCQRALEALQQQEDQGCLDLYYVDEAGFALDPTIPYAWPEPHRVIELPVFRAGRINVLGFMHRKNDLHASMFEPSIHTGVVVACFDAFCGYALKAGQLTYDCRYSTMHGMPVTGGCGFRGLKPLWYNGVPP